MSDYVLHVAEYNRLKEGLGYGFLNLGLFVEGHAKGSFLSAPPSTPGGPPAVRTGTLRRSIHTVAFVDGRPIGDVSNFPDYTGDMQGMGVIIGTNSGYGIYLENGTVHMAARPVMGPAAMAAFGQELALITAGAQQHYHGSP